MSELSKLDANQLLEKIAVDLVQMHADTGIDLAHWEVALEIVSRFYNVSHTITVRNRRIDKADKYSKFAEKYKQSFPTPPNKEHEHETKKHCTGKCTQHCIHKW